MIIRTLESGSFQRSAQKRYGPFDCQPFLCCSGYILLFVIPSRIAVANGAIATFVLLLKEHTCDLFVASIGIQWALPFYSR